MLAAALKVAFSRLGPDELRVITAPVQALVGLLTGIAFTYEAGYGYVSFAHRLVIAKSCTGVNYLLAVFGVLTFTVIPSVRGPRTKLLLVGAMVGGAYAVTVAVNAARIALGVVLYEGGVAWGGLTPERVHRLAGIAVYFVALVAVQRAAQHAVHPLAAGEPRPSGPAREFLAPLVSYGLVAVVLPFANGALAARPRLFLEHCASIAIVTLLLCAFFFGTNLRRHRTRE